jgi:hypothetical protein
MPFGVVERVRAVVTTTMVGAGGSGELGIEAGHGGRGEHRRWRRNSSGKVSGDETHRGGSTPVRWWRHVPATMGSGDGRQRRWAGPTAP